VTLPEKRLALHSIVLHGPPGTGKTTLIEALACACGVQLVEVTPSDIVIGGVDVIEARARAVFTALSLLTRVVIIFDEFEPVLEDRKAQEKNSRQDVFSFVTPGMLPKLKALYEAAKKRGVAYALVTNLIWKLDSAAIREGRFDRKVGVYPPDLLSRVGRLRGQLAKFNEEQQKHKKKGQKQEEKRIEMVSGELRRESEERFRRIIRRSQGASMETLVKEGWGRPPSSLEESKTFKYLVAGGDAPEALPETEDPRLDKKSENNNERKKEQEEWGRVKEWDRKFDDNLKEALKKTPKWPEKRK
jgi:SpoVK/Ycf46/Vps4 family AAA+-type ATPase